MRGKILLAILLVPCLALGSSRLSISFGRRGGGGRPGRGGGVRPGRGFRVGSRGLSVWYNRSTSHSSFSLSFGASSYRSGGGRGYYWGWGYPGSVSYTTSGYSYSAPGVHVYRGWYPYSPYWYRGYAPYSSARGVGPFEYTDAIVFTGPVGGRVYGYQRRVAAAEAQAAEAAVRKPSPAYDKLPVADIIDRGDEQFARGEFAGAVEAYRAAAAKAPNDPMPAYALGHGLFATGAYAEAATELRRGLRLFPGLADVRMDRRDFYGDPAAFDAQLARLLRQVATHPDDTAARFVLAYNLFFTQQYAQARQHLAALGDGDREAQGLLKAIERLR